MKGIKGFTGKESHDVTKADVLEFISKFQHSFGLDNPQGVFFDKETIKDLIEQKNAVGIRYYYGIDQHTLPQLLLVGTDGNRNDLVQGEGVRLSINNPPVNKDGIYDQRAVVHEVTIECATNLTENYRNQNFSGQPIGGFFGKQAILRILNQKKCIGIRFYYGLNEKGVRVMCLMGVDILTKDMVDGYLAELSSGCPPYCGALNPLNSSLKVIIPKLASIV